MSEMKKAQEMPTSELSQIGRKAEQVRFHVSQQLYSGGGVHESVSAERQGVTITVVPEGVHVTGKGPQGQIVDKLFYPSIIHYVNFTKNF